MTGRTSPTPPPIGDLSFALSSLWRRLLHVFGRHDWGPIEDWDWEKGTVTLVGFGCWLCGREK